MDCNFCGKRIPKGCDTIYVTKKGKALYFCSSKCENNMVKLGRKARKVKWTSEYRKEKEVRLKLLAQKKEKPEQSKKEEPKDSKKEVKETKKAPKETKKKEEPKKKATGKKKTVKKAKK